MKTRWMPLMFAGLFIAGCSFVEIGGESSGGSSTGGADPAIKKDITGSTKLAFAWGQRLSPPRELARALINLKDAMHRWTKISVQIDDHLRLESQRIMDMPFVYITTSSQFDLTRQEAENLRTYLENGGFLLLDNPAPQYDKSPAEASFRKMMKDVLGSGARFEPIPKDHEVYHSYFDFDDGPPVGVENQTVTTSRIPVLDSSGNPTAQTRENRAMPRRIPYLEGIWIGDRLAVVLANKGYGVKWAEYSNNDPQLKMGVNMVVYALTAPGGLGSGK